jgi:hypothetical protein
MTATHYLLAMTDFQLQLTNLPCLSLLHSLSMDHTERTISSSSPIVACVSVATDTRLLSHYLAMAVSSHSAVLAFSHYMTIFYWLILFPWGFAHICHVSAAVEYYVQHVNDTHQFYILLISLFLTSVRTFYLTLIFHFLYVES